MCEKQSAFRDGFNTLTRPQLKRYISLGRQSKQLHKNVDSFPHIIYTIILYKVLLININKMLLI